MLSTNDPRLPSTTLVPPPFLTYPSSTPAPTRSRLILIADEPSSRVHRPDPSAPTSQILPLPTDSRRAVLVLSIVFPGTTRTVETDGQIPNVRNYIVPHLASLVRIINLELPSLFGIPG
ncbi:uncharacterized protein ARMOST_08036 [Armillaria ostoyae]|uniref:Uncharacterized protein n=1 Tax=Armillaria ostoyae TaxID=47428 RepID=A0A284R7H3_ARMOS|nr:uncharacterized protein ARMOST_08036 [Armillaria ostoyae]